ncbi:uncharacterized protein LOC120779864 isoform X1 [Bactrocera tryoni]|uniref:uncharacterized protein LOC120779864 isoform X1 n=1 Tax=Bactrocera tryoni TaxID=59916 RepID=UPI001A95E87D|nr:uncharacterized protein LOC120779864 isoform X1 [Bactrocera tryoni]
MSADGCHDQLAYFGNCFRSAVLRLHLFSTCLRKAKRRKVIVLKEVDIDIEQNPNARRRRRGPASRCNRRHNQRRAISQTDTEQHGTNNKRVILAESAASSFEDGVQQI